MAGTNKLFAPIKVGALDLEHRVVLAPLTRFRSTKKEHVPHDIVTEYYGQRASSPGSLLITEATFIAPRAGGYDHVPGIWSDDQIAAWKKITDEVHKRGSYIVMQLWALGRAATPAILKEDGHDYVSSSPSPLGGYDGTPRALTISEIKEYVDLYAQAADNAVNKAGFDGVEVHGANGYLIDQFIQDVVNKRTDIYGGSIENRSRFALEVVDAVVQRVGANRVGIRMSPWGEFHEMKMADPVPQYSHLVSELASNHPDMAYIHMVEPVAIHGPQGNEVLPGESLDFARQIWDKTGSAFLSAGGYTPETALKHMAEQGREKELIVFGRWFISNPDLPKRILAGIKMAPYNRDTFYLPEKREGYVDYPFASEVQVKA